MGRSTGGVLRGFAQLESQQREMKCYSKHGHNHSVDGVEAEVERVKHELRKRAREEVTPIPAIYNDALVDIATQVEDEAVAARLPTFPSLKSSMYRSRRSRLPTLPMSQEDVRIEGRWQKTLSGEQFFSRKEGEVLIIATHTNMRLLAEATTIYVDGTFEICPRLFYQVFTSMPSSLANNSHL